MKFELNKAPGHLLRRLMQAHNAVFAQEVPELTSPQFAILVALSEFGEADQITLAGAAGIDRSTTADLLDRLERSRIVVRSRHEKDGRRNTVRLTAKGQQLLEESLDGARHVGAILLAPLNRTEREVLLGLLSRMLAAQDPAFAEYFEISPSAIPSRQVPANADEEVSEA